MEKNKYSVKPSSVGRIHARLTMYAAGEFYKGNSREIAREVCRIILTSDIQGVLFMAKIIDGKTSVMKEAYEANKAWVDEEVAEAVAAAEKQWNK